MKEGDFIETYLYLDEDGDYVAKKYSLPVSWARTIIALFMKYRPSDCHRFPYTDEDVLLKRPAITLKNSTFCPIVYYVLEKLV